MDREGRTALGPAASAPRAVVVCPRIPHPPTGGAEKRTLRLLEAMAAAGATPHLLTADTTSAGGAAELRSLGWTVEVLPEPPSTPRRRLEQHLRRRPSPYLTGVARRLSELRAQPCALVQVEHAMSAYYAAVLPSAPVVLSTHNVDADMLRSVAGAHPLASTGRLRWRLRASATAAVERRAAREADAVLCVSDADAAHFERLGGRVVVAPNGVDDAFFDVSSTLPDREQVLFFGNLAYEPNRQGLRRFLREGWPRVLDRRRGARLRVVGPGAPDPELGALLASVAGVEAVGVVPDVAAELARCRAAVVPIWQGGGTRLKALEALAAARPVAGTPLGVSGLGVEHGRHALLAERPAELAQALVRLLTEPEPAAGIAARGRELAEGFRWARTLQPAGELYARWVERTG